eukprot:g16179.t1
MTTLPLPVKIAVIALERAACCIVTLHPSLHVLGAAPPPPGGGSGVNVNTDHNTDTIEPNGDDIHLVTDSSGGGGDSSSSTTTTTSSRTTSQPSTRPPARWESAGCFSMEAHDREFIERELQRVPGLTAEACFSRCAAVEYEYLLVANGDLCLCFEEDFVEILTLRRSRGICRAPCAGDPSQHCGGDGAFDIHVARSSDETGLRTPSQEEASGLGGGSGVNVNTGHNTDTIEPNGDDIHLVTDSSSGGGDSSSSTTTTTTSRTTSQPSTRPPARWESAGCFSMEAHDREFIERELQRVPGLTAEVSKAAA